MNKSYKIDIFFPACFYVVKKQYILVCELMENHRLHETEILKCKVQYTL